MHIKRCFKLTKLVREQVRNLCVNQNADLNFRNHKENTPGTSFYQLENIKSKYIANQFRQTGLYALISSRLNDCSLMLFSLDNASV